MSARWNQVLEDMALGKVCRLLTEEGFRVEISDQDGGGLFVYAYKGEEKPEGGFTHWVKLVPGNGADFISDYSTNLEDTIAPANELLGALQD